MQTEVQRRFELVDVDVTDCDPTTGYAAVTYEDSSGLQTMSVVFYLGGSVGLDDDEKHRQALEALRTEIAVEMREACLYQRDLCREMN